MTESTPPNRECPECGVLMTGGFYWLGIPVYPHLKECEALEKKLEREAVTKRHEMLSQLIAKQSGLPDGWSMGIQGYREQFGRSAATKAGINAFERFVGAMARPTPPVTAPGLIGGYGTGKTTLCSAAAMDLARLGIRFRFEVCPELCNTAEAAKKDGGLENVIESAKKAPVLFLDDLGRERATPFWIDSVLWPIINARHGRRPIVVTSNYSFEQLQERYDAVREYGERAVSAGAAIDRLQGSVLLIPYGETSHRKMAVDW